MYREKGVLLRKKIIGPIGVAAPNAPPLWFRYWFMMPPTIASRIVKERFWRVWHLTVCRVSVTVTIEVGTLLLPFLWRGWLHHRWFHPARRPQLGSNAQPRTNQWYGYVNLFEAFTNLKRVLKRSCLHASEDVMGAPIMSSEAILATQEPRMWSEVSLSSLIEVGTNGATTLSREFVWIRRTCDYI